MITQKIKNHWLRIIALSPARIIEEIKRPRKRFSVVEKIHIAWMSLYLTAFSLIIIANIFTLTSELVYGLNFEQLLAYTSFTLISSWLVFDFVYPAIPVSRTYIFIHHIIGFLSLYALMILNQYYFLAAAVICLQEGYTLFFRKLLDTPRAELIVDLFRFVILGALFQKYYALLPWYVMSLAAFFILNNMYFFMSTHQRAFRRK